MEKLNQIATVQPQTTVAKALITHYKMVWIPVAGSILDRFPSYIYQDSLSSDGPLIPFIFPHSTQLGDF